MTTCPRSVELGAYVLDALSPSERADFEKHLLQCPICRAEHGQLSGLPGILRRVDTATAEAFARHGEVDLGYPVDPAPHDSSAAAAAAAGWAGPTGSTDGHRPRATRSRQRIAYAVLAAAAIAGLAFALGLAVPRLAAQRAPALVAMQSVVPVSPISAQIALTPAANGTKILMRCTYTGSGDRERWTFRLAVVPRTGAPEEVNTWTAGYGDQLELNGHTRLALADIVRVELRKADGTTLLTYQR